MGPDEIVEKCGMSDGFLLFAAILSGAIDEKGHPIISFEYRRERLSLEDAKLSLTKLREFVDAELRELVSDGGEI